MSAAGMTTNSALQLINKELGLHQTQFLKTDMGAPKLKLIYSKDPDNRTLKTINRVTQNLSRLNSYSKVNWSHRDLNKKLLSAPSNIGRNYDKSTNKKNNENLTLNQMNSIINYDEIASGSPVQRDQRLSKLRKYYGFVDNNSSQFKTFTEIEQSVNPKSKKTFLQQRYNLRSQQGYGTHFRTRATRYLVAQHIFTNHTNNHIYNNEGKKEALDSLLNGQNAETWI